MTSPSLLQMAIQRMDWVLYPVSLSISSLKRWSWNCSYINIQAITYLLTGVHIKKHTHTSQLYIPSPYARLSRKAYDKASAAFRSDSWAYKFESLLVETIFTISRETLVPLTGTYLCCWSSRSHVSLVSQAAQGDDIMMWCSSLAYNTRFSLWGKIYSDWLSFSLTIVFFVSKRTCISYSERRAQLKFWGVG